MRKSSPTACRTVFTISLPDERGFSKLPPLIGAYLFSSSWTRWLNIPRIPWFLHHHNPPSLQAQLFWQMLGSLIKFVLTGHRSWLKGSDRNFARVGPLKENGYHTRPHAKFVKQFCTMYERTLWLDDVWKFYMTDQHGWNNQPTSQCGANPPVMISPPQRKPRENFASTALNWKLVFKPCVHGAHHKTIVQSLLTYFKGSNRWG